MTTVATDQLSEMIESLKESAERVLGNESADGFADFENYVSEVEAFARETQQIMWAADARAAIRRLEKGEALTDADREVIRVFLISDAEHYLEHENNLSGWRQELRRLMDDLLRRSSIVDRHTIADLRGVLKDAARLVPNLRNYLGMRERVAKFEQAVASLDTPSRAMLGRLLKEQLTAHMH